ncbi:MAG TPA: lipoyl synthase [Oscillospiraceae bacterium]|nr:lipoyl synthase [Oscillospiraceae bacterium]
MRKRKPQWLRKSYVEVPNQELIDILKELNLNTVCNEADCPNALECFHQKIATFMILGKYCTRNCRFCNVTTDRPQIVDPDEPARIGLAVARLGLKYIVVTSVTRDDLPDGGAEHFAKVIRAIQKESPDTAIEVLIPDFRGNEAALKTVTEANPEVISHNMETVKNLHSEVCPQANYQCSLAVLGNIKKLNPLIRSKTGIMLGLGETKEEVEELLDDLRVVNCEFLTIGQYLAPSSEHLNVKEYVHPDLFDEYARIAREKGFAFVASAPYVRSSYHAGEALGL